MWEPISRRLGKKQAWAISWIGQAFGFLSLLLVPRGEDGFMLFTVLISIGTVFSGAAAVIAPSILADIVDFDTLKTGAYRAGNYFALYGLANKIVVAIGGGIGVRAARAFSGMTSRIPRTTGPAPMPQWLPCASLHRLPCDWPRCYCLWRYPLDERRQSIIRRRLEQREARLQRLQTATVV